MDLPSRTMGSLATLVGWTLEGRLLLVSHWVVRPRIKTAYGTVLLLAKEGLGTSWRGGCRRPPGCCCWLPSRGLKFIDREETVDAILVRHQAPGPPSRPIVGRRPSSPTRTLFGLDNLLLWISYTFQTRLKTHDRQRSCIVTHMSIIAEQIHYWTTAK